MILKIWDHFARDSHGIRLKRAMKVGDIEEKKREKLGFKIALK